MSIVMIVRRALALVTIAATAATAQRGPATQAGPRPGTVSPTEPRWGTVTTISYDPAVPGAVFAATDSVRATIRFVYTHRDSATTRTLVLLRTGATRSARAIVPRGASAMNVRFTSGQRQDLVATLSVTINDSAGRQARGANLTIVDRAVPFGERVRRELAAYPDEYGVYPDKWDYAVERSLRDSVIGADLVALRSVHVTLRLQPELLYAIEYGALRVKDEPAAHAAVKQLAERFPFSLWTGLAVLDYQRVAYQRQMTGGGVDQVESLKWHLIRTNPGSSLASVVLSENADDRTIPQATLEPAARQEIVQEPDSPFGYLYLAEVLDAHHAKSAEARRAIARAIGGLLDRNTVLPRPVERYLPAAYRVEASVALRMGDLGAALSAIRAAESIEIDTSPDLYMLDAAIWLRSGNVPLAERAWVVAWSRGSADAEDSLKAMYLRSGKPAGKFANYLADKSASLEASGVPRPVAADFTLTTLAGDTVSLSKLRGKVVALNFWYVGCIPCRVEMPSLDTLVADYKGKDVVFLAAAWDDAPALQKFIVTTRFDYTIIPDSKPFALDYGVSLYPTHVIIGRDGKIDLKVFGEDPKRTDLLRLIIDRALARGGAAH